MRYFKEKSWEVPLYRGVFVLVLSNSKKKINKKFAVKDKNIFAHSVYKNYKGKQGFVMILNVKNKENQITNGTISHEALHIANFIALSRGFIADFNNDESMAYLNEWIVNKCYRFIAKNKFKIGL